MLEEIKELLVNELNIANPDDITMDSNLTNDLGLNSLELAELVVNCEEKFDIEIDEEVLHELITIGDVVRYLEEKLDRH